ncbi:MAG: transcription antitermination factor NusB [Bryobacterales bacterium]|nr:transcription antitermination factor NusB [Bryobacterales bacterium]
MPSRHKSRQRALQILFQWDARRQPVEEAISNYYESLYSEESAERPERDPFVDILVQGVVRKLDRIDDLIRRHATSWRIERMAAVDRNVLRLGIFELAELETPAAVVIDEALELARRYSAEESVHFVNGVLDAARRELRASTDPATPAS